MGFAFLALTLAPEGGVMAQSSHAERQLGVLLVAHGAGTEWNSLVHDLAAHVALSYPVETAFLMGVEAGTFSFQVAAKRLAERGVAHIVVVPFLVSSYGAHIEQIKYLAGATDSLAAPLRQLLETMGHTRPELDVELSVTPARGPVRRGLCGCEGGSVARRWAESRAI
ncbi:MAG: CbiX/SirB N-terminal domain-containing protein [Gemmatimonadales bacterium]